MHKMASEATEGGALEGLVVLELGEGVSAAYCTKLLANLGAEVIKIERPDIGDEIRRLGPFPSDIPNPEKGGLFLYLNTDKLGISLNIQTAAGQKILNELLVEVDALVENNSPKLMEGLGLNYPRLREVNPRLVMTSITPFGQTGPYRDYKAYDINVAAAGGISCGIGLPEREPLAPPYSISGFQAGLCAACATMIALLARDKIGNGQHVDISEAEAWAGIHLGQEVLMYLFQWRVTKRTGHHSMDFPYPNCILPCKDGYIFVGAIEGKEWHRLLELMGGPEWANEPRFKDRTVMNNLYADELDSYIIPWLMERTKEELFALSMENQLTFGPVRNMKELVRDQHLKERGFFVNVSQSDGELVTFPGAPCLLSETPWRIVRGAPLLGEHNEEIYCGRLGYSKQDLMQLRTAKVI